MRRVWRLIPKRLRGTGAARKLATVVGSRFRIHNQSIYTRAYYESDVENAAAVSAPVIVESVVNAFQPKHVIDVGCGSGAILETFARHGVSVFGLEYSEAGCNFCRERGVAVKQFDVRFDDLGDFTRPDVVFCTEVAEHIAEPYSQRLVDLLTSIADRVIFTAATPGQGGTDHINEQPRDYWIAKFRDRKYCYRSELTELWSEEWRQSGVAYWYWANVFVFEKGSE